MKIEFEFVPIPHSLFEEAMWTAISDAELRIYLYVAHVCNRLGVDTVVLTDGEMLKGRSSAAGNRFDRGAGVRSRTTLNAIRSRGSKLFEVSPANGEKGYQYRLRSFSGQRFQRRVQELNKAVQLKSENCSIAEQATIRKEELQETERICIPIAGNRHCMDDCNGWSFISHELRNKLGDRKWETWFKPMRTDGCKEGTLQLRCPEQFIPVLESYVPTIRDAVGKTAGCSLVRISAKEPETPQGPP